MLDLAEMRVLCDFRGSLSRLAESQFLAVVGVCLVQRVAPCSVIDFSCTRVDAFLALVDFRSGWVRGVFWFRRARREPWEFGRSSTEQLPATKKVW